MYQLPALMAHNSAAPYRSSSRGAASPLPVRDANIIGPPGPLGFCEDRGGMVQFYRVAVDVLGVWLASPRPEASGIAEHTSHRAAHGSQKGRKPKHEGRSCTRVLSFAILFSLADHYGSCGCGFASHDHVHDHRAAAHSA